MKTGLESSLASVHVEDYIEGDEDLSTDDTDEDDGRHIRKYYR